MKDSDRPKLIRIDRTIRTVFRDIDRTIRNAILARNTRKKFKNLLSHWLKNALHHKSLLVPPLRISRE
ncbi:hypothetical protein YC2023_114215 [Brassica napus]